MEHGQLRGYGAQVVGPAEHCGQGKGGEGHCQLREPGAQALRPAADCSSAECCGQGCVDGGEWNLGNKSSESNDEPLGCEQ
eukprot:1156123-Pelagomonas_calceolata.AAC.2